MSFLKKLAKLGAGVLDEMADASKTYVRDANRAANQQEKRLKNVDRNSLSAQGKEKYDRINNRVDQIRTMDGDAKSSSWSDKASSLRDWAKDEEDD